MLLSSFQLLHRLVEQHESKRPEYLPPRPAWQRSPGVSRSARNSTSAVPRAPPSGLLAASRNAQLRVACRFWQLMAICRPASNSLRLLYASLGQIDDVVTVAGYWPISRRERALGRRHELPPTMFATLLTSITSRHRAWAFGLTWLLVLTILNVQTGGAWRSTVLFAIPVVLVAWNDWRLGFVFAALAVCAAKYGGAMPEPGSPSPIGLDGMIAFIKLSIAAAVASAWSRRLRLRRPDVQDAGKR